MTPFPILERYQHEIGYALDSTAVQRFTTYRDLLVEWNKRFNLTRVNAPQEIETRLFLNALAMHGLVQSSERNVVDELAIRLLDVGAGAGFPGLPLKIVSPDIELVMIEATAKKVGFLSEVIRELGLANAIAIHGRAEALAHDRKFRGSFDVVTARAVARLPALLEICMPFCRVGGRGIFPKGVDIEPEIKAAARAQRELRCEVVGVERPSPPELDATTYVVVRQTSTVPSRFPRRPGIPAKDPL